MKNRYDYDVIVVGMGAAGVTASSTLARAGKRVLALEAQDRVGGRVRTVPFGDGLVELGAEWIHGERPSRVFDAAKESSITLQKQDITFSILTSDNNLDAADEEFFKELVGFVMTYEEEAGVTLPKGTSFGEVATKKIKEYIKERKPELLANEDFMTEMLAFMDLLIDNLEASNSWYDVTAQNNYEWAEGHQHWSWHKHGYKTFFDILLNKYNNGPGLPTLDIKLNSEVTNIAWSPSESLVEVTCGSTTYTAPHVIVTVSLGVLKERHTSLFSPPLPADKILSIEKMSMGVMDKIELSFEEAWWPKTTSFFGFLWRGKDKRKVPQENAWTTKIFSCSTPTGSDNVITLWLNGDNAKLVETLPEEVVKTKCVELLRKFFGSKVNIPEPTGILRSSWFSNPFTRGSYSFDNLNTDLYPDMRAVLGRPLMDAAGEPRVLFAGEATELKYFSTVHGAAATGYREAIRLLPRSKI